MSICSPVRALRLRWAARIVLRMPGPMSFPPDRRRTVTHRDSARRIGSEVRPLDSEGVRQFVFGDTRGTQEHGVGWPTGAFH